MRLIALLFLTFAAGVALAQETRQPTPREDPQADHRGDLASQMRRELSLLPSEPFLCDSVVANDCLEMFARYQKSPCQWIVDPAERRDCSLNRAGDPGNSKPPQ